MSAKPQPPAPRASAARKAREHFVLQATKCLEPMGDAIRERLLELAQAVAGAREMQDRRDALLDYDRKGRAFLQGTLRAWQKAIDPPPVAARARLEGMDLTLVDEDVVERKILASRLALSVQEKAVWDLNDLKVRMQHLEGEDQSATDVLRPEAFCQLIVEQWGEAGLTRESWSLVQDVVQRTLLEHLPPAYKSTNEFLVSNNVLRDIDLSSRVRRASSSSRPARAGGQTPQEGDSTLRDSNFPSDGYGQGFDGGESAYPSGSGALGGGSYPGAPAGGAAGAARQAGAWHPGHQGPRGAHPGQGGRAGAGPAAYRGPGGSPGYGQSNMQGAPGEFGRGGAVPGGAPMGQGEDLFDSEDSGLFSPAGAAGQPYRSGAQYAGGQAAVQGRHAGVHDETRMLTASPPLARARQRATGVLGQLRRLLVEKVGGFDSRLPAQEPTPALAEALQQRPVSMRDTVVQSRDSTAQGMVYDDAAVHEVALDLRRRTGELKKKAATSSEKATIEIVALMFQSILAEERIPPAIRLWFARLQMPVLRVAIAEPEFFGSLEHPARQLIDRMGSCVLGFDAATISGSALEAEIKRVVQVIEQYPETGRRVFQLVYDEFQKFLSRFLTEQESTRKLVSIAQQVEQKETLAVQYTIELRKLLADLPVRDEIREFLFKIWAEALAVAAVKHGPQHRETLLLKSTASDLVWAAGAKPNRQERARVIQELPALLQRLRQGMNLIGLVGKEQDQQVKVIGDIMADAFMSKTEPIAQERIETMAKRLEHLEDFMPDEASAADLPLDRETIEMMLGIDASGIEVIADGGSRPSDAMLAWANELLLGNWFSLDHNGATAQVQYVWRSARKQLHLFAGRDGRSYLVQAGRLAAYLQAGLLLPAEEEALTVRATRDALAKLDANPERLLQ